MNVGQQNLCSTAESIGDFIEYWGFKSIHGRIWALIYLSKSPISTPEIVKILKVSKASVSIGINDLIDHQLIESSEKVRNGAQTYIAAKTTGQVVRQVLRERELELVNNAEKNLSKIFSMSKSELEENNICEKNLHEILELTRTSKKIITRLTSERFNTIYSWLTYFKKASKLI